MLSRRTLLACSLGAATVPAQTQPQIAEIDRVLRSGIATRGIPNVVGMAANAKQPLYRGAFGVRDKSGKPVTMDSIYSIASMTKAITTTAALQLVEAGKITLDEPVGRLLPLLAEPKVLRGFDSKGAPIFATARTPVTLRHLLTHTSGLCYDIWDANEFRFMKNNKDPLAGTVLMFEPGARWQYGTGLDWAGRLVEKVSGQSLEDYFQGHILKPLGMKDTSYILPPSKFDRVVAHWQRGRNGKLQQQPRQQPQTPKEFNGGGGLHSTAADYIRFCQMILNKGENILKPSTVAMMEQNQIGNLSAGRMKSMDSSTTSDVDIQPGHTEKWGLGFLINTDPYDGGRSAGSLAWAGILNTFYWIDVQRALCGVLLMQFLPFVDREAVGLLGDFERAVYSSIAPVRQRVG